MRRKYWVVVANVVVLTALAGCRDSIVTPSESPNGTPVSIALAPAGRPSVAIQGPAASAGSVQFTVGPQGGVFMLGSNAVVFPAKSICDPSTSGYGIGTWSNACSVLNKPITITAKYGVTALGASWIDFDQHIRFVPSADPTHQVWLFMSTPGARTAATLSPFNILYVPTVGGAAIDEASSNPIYRSYVDTKSGISARVIQHFSGFITASGRSCEPSPDNPDCVDSGGTALNP